MRIALITGASSGMGVEFVKLLDREGLDELWLVARRKDRLDSIAAECKTPVRAIALDLLKEGACQELLDMAKEADARVAWLINSAGFGEFGEVAVQELSTQMRMIDLNVKVTVEMCNLFVPMTEKGGHIVNLGSASVFNPLPYFNIYASTKSFILHYSRGLYYELKPRGIHVSVFCPGWVRTEFFEHTRDDEVRSPKSYSPMTEPQDVVRYAMKKAKKGRCFIIHGWFTKMQHLLSKILPRSVLIRIWLGMLTEKK